MNTAKAAKGPYYAMTLKQNERHHPDLAYAVVNSFGVVCAWCDSRPDADWIAEALREQFQREHAAAQREQQARAIIELLATTEPRESEGWQQVGLFHDSINVLWMRDQARAWLADRAEQRAAAPTLATASASMIGPFEPAADAPTAPTDHPSNCQCPACEAWWNNYFADDPDLDAADAPPTEQEAR